jgi:hypothetical protein
LFGTCKRVSELLELCGREKSLSRFFWIEVNAARGVVVGCACSFTRRKREERSQHRHESVRNVRRFGKRSVQTPQVYRCDVGHALRTKGREEVLFPHTPVLRSGPRLVPCLDVVEIRLPKFLDGGSPSSGCALRSGVVAVRDLSQFTFCESARLVGSQLAMSA